MEFDENGRLIRNKSLRVPKINYKETLQGETVTKAFKVYKTVSNKLDDYINSHGREIIRDIISKAILEYVEKQKVRE